jgi:hypothetical protein
MQMGQPPEKARPNSPQSELRISPQFSPIR